MRRKETPGVFVGSIRNLASFVAIVESAGGDFSDINSRADLNTEVGIFTNGSDPESLQEAVARAAIRR